MFVWSVNIRRFGKYCALLALIAAGIGLTASAVHIGRAETVALQSSFQGVKGNEGRIEFLARYGWEVSAEAEETVAVSVPEEFDSVYNEYAAIQREQGFLLEKFKGKTLTRYTYAVLNYEGQPEGTVKANILMSGTTVVGGDICSVLSDGFIHGFERPNAPSPER